MDRAFEVKQLSKQLKQINYKNIITRKNLGI